MSLGLTSYTQVVFTNDYYGNTQVTDSYGTLVASGYMDYYGNYVWKDTYGSVICNQSKDYYGNIVTKDTYGNVLAIYKKSYYNNAPIGSLQSFAGVQVFNVKKRQVSVYPVPQGMVSPYIPNSPMINAPVIPTYRPR